MKGISFSAGHMDDLETIVRIRAWFGLSRPPFHSVGVLPFLDSSPRESTGFSIQPFSLSG